MDTQPLRNRPAYTLDRETAPAMWLVGTLWLIQAAGIQTNNRSTFLEQVMPRGLCPPTHRHPLAIEGFYAGTLIHLPRMVTTALFARFASRGKADFQGKLLSAMRYGFGGHLERSAK
jgi:hypothetical protein